jgi:hypothetical protein
MGNEIVECSFLIPIVRDSDKAKHRPLAWRLLVDELRRVFPQGHSGPQMAFYLDCELLPGQWVDDAEHRVNDISRRYVVAIPPSRLHDLRSLLRRAANTFVQKAIYLSVAGRVEFVTARPADGFLGDESQLMKEGGP